MVDTAADARDNEEVERAEREAARVEATQRKETLKAALTVSKVQKRHDRAEVRALRVANDQQRDRAAIRSRAHEGPAENVTNDNMAAAQHAVREQPHRPPTPPYDLPPPPRLPPVVEPPIGPIPPPPSALDAQQVALYHTWVPQQWGTTDLGSMTTLMAGITSWGCPLDASIFNQGAVMTNGDFLTEYKIDRAGVTAYTTAMPIVFRSREEYNRMWTAILLLDVYHTLADAASDAANWVDRGPPRDLVRDGPGLRAPPTAGPHGYTLSEEGVNLVTCRFRMHTSYDVLQPVHRNLSMRQGDVVMAHFYSAARTRRNDYNYRRHHTYLCIVEQVNNGPAPAGALDRPHVYFYMRIFGSAVERGQGPPRTPRGSGSLFVRVVHCGYIGNEMRAFSATRAVNRDRDNRLSALLLNKPRPLNETLATLDDDWEYNTSRARVNTVRPAGDDAPDENEWLRNQIRDSYGVPFLESWEDYLDLVHEYDGVRANMVANNYSNVPCTTTQLLAVALMVSGTQGLPQAHNSFRDCFTVVIGPPGTGKTRTLMHAISVILHRQQVYRDELTEMHRLHDVYFDAQDNAVPRAIAGMRAANTDRVLPRILIVTPTHKALDVIEEKLLNGSIIFFDMNLENWNRTTPFYQRLSHPAPAQRNRRLDRRRAEMFPVGFTDDYNEFITLCTLGSVHAAFRRPRNNNNYNLNSMRYDWIFVDEVSMASDMDMSRLFQGILETTQIAQQLPNITLLGDPQQLPPHSRGVPSIFKLVQQCAFFERLVATNVPGCPGPNTVRCIELDRQYRMHPQISELVNIISGRQVQTAISDATPWMLENPNVFARVYDGLIAEVCRQVDFDNPVMWFDPYQRLQDNIRLPAYNQILDRHPNTRESSIIEVAYILLLVRHLIYNNIVDNYRSILILTPYNEQRSVLTQVLPQRMNDLLPPDNNFGTDRILTVDSAEGTEANTIIYSPGRMQNAAAGVGEFSHLNNLRGLHVLASRAQRRFYVVGSRQLFRDRCPVWGRALDYFELPHDAMNA